VGIAIARIRYFGIVSFRRLVASDPAFSELFYAAVSRHIEGFALSPLQHRVVTAQTAATAGV
jgi:hypothetical protein